MDSPAQAGLSGECPACWLDIEPDECGSQHCPKRAEGPTAGQEPVAWAYEAPSPIWPGYWEKRLDWQKPHGPSDEVRNVTPLYASPPEAASGLEVGPIFQILRRTLLVHYVGAHTTVDIVSMEIAAHQIAALTPTQAPISEGER